ncbi:hypothetical protein MMC26_007062 [Xylographa opegraphella]|nr:hypothetical protein [Xylographa opegraphella]
MPISFTSSAFPSLHHPDGLTCLYLRRRRALSNPSRPKQLLHTLLDGFKVRDRRNCDLNIDDLGCFCAPQPEEWWWNSEIVGCTEDAEMQGVSNEFYADPTVSWNEEASTMEEDLGELEKDKPVPAIPLCRSGSCDAHITMRYQTQLAVLEWRQDLSYTGTTQSLVVTTPAGTECEPLSGYNYSLGSRSEATVTRNGSRASTASSITLTAKEEQEFFDQVRKKLPAVQRSIDNEVLRSDVWTGYGSTAIAHHVTSGDC